MHVHTASCAKIVECTVEYAKECAVFFGRGCKGRIDDCSISDRTFRLRAFGDGYYVEAFICTMQKYSILGIDTQEGGHLFPKNEKKADGRECFESRMGYGVSGASSVLRLTGCKCTSEHFRCFAKEEGTLAEHELHASGCGHRDLLAQSGAMVKLEKCIFAQNIQSGIFALGKHTQVHAEAADSSKMAHTASLQEHQHSEQQDGRLP